MTANAKGNGQFVDFREHKHVAMRLLEGLAALGYNHEELVATLSYSLGIAAELFSIQDIPDLVAAARRAVQRDGAVQRTNQILDAAKNAGLTLDETTLRKIAEKMNEGVSADAAIASLTAKNSTATVTEIPASQVEVLDSSGVPMPQSFGDKKFGGVN